MVDIYRNTSLRHLLAATKTFLHSLKLLCGHLLRYGVLLISLSDIDMKLVESHHLPSELLLLNASSPLDALFVL